ncbi:MAG: ABC transporter ATP-binding protein [Spirochaetes bacterium]|nr:ABC transporter ATP-binding protein [Spirochaetota bacterium]
MGEKSDVNNQDINGEELLLLRDVYKNYGSVEALKGINLAAKKGECLVILGPSGAGKTTTLKVIAGLESVKSGEIYFKNRIINNLEPKDRNIAMVFETYALYPHISVYKNLASSLDALKMDEKKIKQRVRDVATMLGIYPFLDRRPGFLSGGQRQRVALGRALVKPVDLYLMDEPIAHLDAKLRYQMISEFKHLQETLKISIIYVTHDWREAMSLGNHIIVLNQGTVEQSGKKEEIFKKPKNTFVAQIIGDPPMNLLHGRISGSGGKPVFKSGDIEIALKERLEPGPAIMGVRSSKIHLTSSSGNSRIKAEVYSCGKHGMNTVVSMKIGDEIFKTEFKGSQKFEIGQKIFIQLDLSSTCIFNEKKELIRVLGE